MQTTAQVKIGILGGTFDPVHNAHLKMACQAQQEFSLERVLLMPTKAPPHKLGKTMAGAADRLEMVRLAIQGIDYLECSDFELKPASNLRERYTYTAETLYSLNQLYPEVKWYFIVGADSLLYMEKWNKPDVIFHNAVILAAVRNRISIKELQEKALFLQSNFNAEIFFLHMQDIDISSTEIRKRLSKGMPIDSMVPPAVADYLKDHALYCS